MTKRIPAAKDLGLSQDVHRAAWTPSVSTLSRERFHDNIAMKAVMKIPSIQGYTKWGRSIERQPAESLGC